MNRRVSTVGFIVVFLYLVIACRELSKFETSGTAQTPIFSVKDFENYSVTSRNYLIQDISVGLKNCNTNNCVTWELVRDMDNSELIKENYTSFSIEYGQKIDNMELRHAAKPLTEGVYTIAATVAIIENNKAIESRLVIGSFQVVNKAGKLVLLPDNSI